MAGGRHIEARGAARGHRRDEAGVFVVVEQDPASFELAPADALTSTSIGVPIGPQVAPTIFAVMSRLNAVCVSRRLPCWITMSCLNPKSSGATKRGDAAGLIALHRRDAIGDRRVFAAMIFGDRDLPAALHSSPDKIELLLGWEACRRSPSAACRPGH